MAINNGAEGTEGDVENQTKNNKKTLSFGSSQQEFISQKLSENSNYDGGAKSYDDFFEYLNATPSYRELANNLVGIDEDEKSNILKQLKLELVSQKTLLQHNTKQALKAFDLEYDLSKSQKKELETRFVGVSEVQKNKLINSEIARKRFLQDNEIFEDGIIKYKDTNNFDAVFAGIKIAKLSQDEKRAFYNITQNKNSISNEDIELVVKLLPRKKRREFLRVFQPQISLQDVREYNILSDTELKELVKKHMQPLAREQGMDIDNIFIHLNDFDELILDIDDFSPENIEKILDQDAKILKNIVRDINEIKSEFREELGGDFMKEVVPEGENEDIHESFINFIQSNSNIGKIDEAVRNSIHKLRVGSYIQLSQNGDGKDDGFYKVVQTDVGSMFETKSLALKNISAPGKAFRRDSEVTEEYKAYTTLYDLFVADGKQKNTQIHILSSDEFEALDLEEIVHGEIESVADLKLKLDKIDPEGKDVPFEAGKCVITDTSNNPPQAFEISSLTNTHIVLKSGGRKQSLTLNDFYDACEFKKGKFSRQSYISSFEQCMDIAGQSGLEAFENIDLHEKSKKLVLSSQKNADLNKYSEIQYFIGDDGEAIKIESINDTEVTYTLGKIQEGTAREGKDGKVKKSFKGEYKTSGFNDFLLDIKHHNMVADTTNAYANIPETSDEVKMKTGLMGRWLQCLSMTDMIAGGNQIIQSFKESFERGDKLKAAKFANSLTKIIPMSDNAKLELQMSQEAIEKDTIQEMIDRMKKMGSHRLIKKVRGVLENKGSQEYEVIACLFTIVEKYGDLYPKGLVDFEKSQIWFKRLGGAKYPDIIPEVRKEVDDPDKSTSGKKEAINFTEDEFIFRLLTERAKDGTLRSKINKDYRGALNKGVEDEMKDGEEKVAEQFTAQGKIDHVVGEIENRGFGNALGGMEKLFKKNGNSVAMQASPFIYTFAGSGPELIGPLRYKTAVLAVTTPYASLGFATSKEKTELYQQAIIRIYEKKGEDGDASAVNKAAELKSILAMSWKTKETSRAKRLSHFWAQNGKELSDIITFKDPYLFLNKDEEPLFAQFFDTMNGFLGDDEAVIDGDALGAGVYEENPTVFAGKTDDLGLPKGGGLELIRGDQGFNFGDLKSQHLVEMYFNYLKNLRENSSLTDEEKKKVFLAVFPNIEAALRKKAMRGNPDEAFEKYAGSSIVLAFRRYNLDAFRGDGNLAYKGQREYDEFLERVWNNFNSFGRGITTDETVEQTSTDFNDIMGSNTPNNNRDGE